MMKLALLQNIKSLAIFGGKKEMKLLNT